VVATKLPRVLRRLYPAGDDVPPAELAARLRLGELAPEGRPHVALNMVSTLDGKAAFGGRTAPISSDVDRELFHHLRTQVDAVMVGAGTVRAERYGRIVKTDELRAKRESEDLAADALAVVVSASLALDPNTPLFQEQEQRVVIATESDRELEGTTSQIAYERTGDDLPLLMARLRAEHRVRSILCEGGPTLNSHLLVAGLVDELFLSLSPKLIGGADGLTIVAGRPMVEPAGAQLVWLCEAEGELFTRWRIG
jgi:riboflavin-specific deaminase-like protein